MHQAGVVDRLQPAAGLREDVAQALGGKLLPGGVQHLLERHALQQRHDEEGLDYPGVLELADIEDLDDVGMVQVGQDAPLFIEHLDGAAALDIPDRL